MSAKQATTKPAQKKSAPPKQKRAKSAPEVNRLPEKSQKPKPVTQRELLDAPSPTTCPQGGEHEWTEDDCSKCHEPKPRINVPAATETPVGAVETVALNRKGSKKPAKAQKGKRDSLVPQLSALDAAAKVLGEAGEPMTTGQMIEAMAAKGYWSSPNGQTPAATLYSAILRQINTKGANAQFIKTEPGHFALNA